MKIQKFIICLIILFCTGIISGQTITGPIGLFTIPTAELLGDKKISIGVNFLDKKYVEYSNYNYDIAIVNIVIGFLPFLELTGRATRQLDIPESASHVMDRYLGMKLKLKDEEKYWPSIAVGLNNPFNTGESAKHFNSTYIVLTKTIALNNFLREVKVTLGYGSDLISAVDYQFVGIFGGIDLRFADYISFLAEYDADRFNGGVKVTLFDHLQILAGLMNFESFSGGMSINWEL